MAFPATTIQGARGGYPTNLQGGTRTIQPMQAPTTYSGGTTAYSGGTTGYVSRPATTIGSSPFSSTTLRSGTTMQAAAAPRITSGTTMQAAAAPRTTYTTGTTSISAAGTTPLTSISGTRQARVISAPGTVAASPTYISGVGQRSVISAASPSRIIGSGGLLAARPAKVISAGEANTIGGPSVTQGAYEVKHKDDPQLQNLKELRKTSGMKNVPVGDALQAFKSAASDGKLTRDQFNVAYSQLLQQFGVEVPAESVQNAVFDLFDRDDNGVVDMMELICGASLLCTGTEEEKIHAVFNVFDENGDGVISMDEMFKFLTSVFKVVLTPNVMSVMNSMGVTVESAEDLASVTALECFKTADLNHDGRLSVTEFKNWFFAPRNDPSFLFSPVRKLLQ